MSKKQAIFKTRGMNRDLSVSAFNPEFSFENINLRLSTNEGNTTMSWVNEKGTSLISFSSHGKWNDDDTSDTTFVTSIAGMPIGTAVINHQLVLFTHVVPDDNSASEQESNPIDSDDSDASNSDNLDNPSPVPMLSDTPTSPQEEVVVSTPSEGKDHIYVIKYTDNNKREVKCKELFSGNLQFDEKHPLETLTSYESSDIQKVYWVDGINQPRMINLSTPESHYYNRDATPINSSFDFIEELALSEYISVTKGFSTGGEFPSGVIQYAFTYYNKYGQESNIFHVTPLYYISHSDRGGAPDEKIGNVFNISVSNLDSKFDYLRIYSIIRTSLNATPIVRRVHDIKINAGEAEVVYADDFLRYELFINNTTRKQSKSIIPLNTKIESYLEVSNASFPKIGDSSTSTFESIEDFASNTTNTTKYPIPVLGEDFGSNPLPQSLDVDESWLNPEEEEEEPASEYIVLDSPIYYTIIDTTNHTAAFVGDGERLNVPYVEIPDAIDITSDGQSVPVSYTVTQIQEGAFFNNKNLKGIRIPSTITSIGELAFRGCQEVKDFWCYALQPPTTAGTVGEGNTGTSTFNPALIGYCTLHVPENSLKLYKFAEQWEKFGIKVTIVEESSEDVPNEEESSENDSNESQSEQDEYIVFADPVVEGICVTNFGADGKLSERQAAAVSRLGAWFKDNEDIVSFDELKYFTGLTTLTDAEFEGCSNLKFITIPNGVNNISGAFSDCDNLTSITFECDYVGSWFNNFTSIKEVILENNVASVESGAFTGCTNLTYVTLNHSIASEDRTGSGNTPYLSSIFGIQVKEYTLKGVTSIGNSLFVGCTNLMRVDLPESLVTIGAFAFASCQQLSYINIPSSVTSIGESAFASCIKLSSVGITDLWSWCSIDFANMFSNPLYLRRGALYLNGKIVRTLQTPTAQNFTEIKKYAFVGCSSISQVIVTSNVGTIGDSAFYCCDNIREVYINRSNIDTGTNTSNVTTLYKHPFYTLSNKTCSLYVPEDSINNYKQHWWDVIFKNRIYPLSNDSRFEEGAKYYYKFDKKDFKDLILKNGDTYYTWGSIADDDNTTSLYVFPGWIRFKQNDVVVATGPVIICEKDNDGYELCNLSILQKKSYNGGDKWLIGNTTTTLTLTIPEEELSLYNDNDPVTINNTDYYYSTYPYLRLKHIQEDTVKEVYLWPEGAGSGWKIQITSNGDNYECRCYNSSSSQVAFKTWTINDNYKYLDESTYSFVDSNTVGEFIDSTHLLYLGGDSIVAKTLEQKDNTLFLGNINLLREPISDTIKDVILSNSGSSSDSPLITRNISCVLQKRSYALPIKIASGETAGSMGYMSTLTSTDADDYQGASAFKNGEYYRLGIQFQHKTGKWSEPVWIGDTQCSVTNLYSDETNGCTWVPEFRYTLDGSICGEIYNADYRKVRAVYVQPQEQDRTILCQGVACPTMYRKCDRETGKLHAQSSWLYRVKFNTDLYKGYKDKFGIAGAVGYEGALPSMWDYRDGAIQSTSVSNQAPTNGQSDQGGLVAQDSTRSGSSTNNTVYNSNVTKNEYLENVWMPYYRSTEITGAYNEDDIYRIDNSFITINSPDVEFDFTRNYSDLKTTLLYKVGHANLTYTFGDIDIQTSSPTIGDNCRGFIHKPVVTHGTSALISGNYYEDCVVWDWYLNNNEANPKHEIVYKQLKWDEGGGDYDDVTPALPALWPVCMWQKKGSLNNDVNREGRSSVLLKKIISNYRNAVSSSFNPPAVIKSYDVKLWNNTEAAQIIKVDGKVYQGCVDTMVTPSVPSAFYLTGLPLRRKTGDNNNVFAWYPEFSDVPVVKMFKPAPPKTNDNQVTEDNAAYSMLIYNGTSGNHYVDTGYYLPPVNISSEGYINITECKYNAWTYMEQQWSTLGTHSFGLVQNRESVPIKYKSSPHLVASLGSDLIAKTDGAIPIVEVRKGYEQNVLFGGTSDEAFQAATWIPCGPAVPITGNNNVVIPFKWGDTYYQRYECLKTYAYTPDDINQVVEIGSFMLETRVNIDGRYDRNRCQTSNLYASPQNFNLINPVYSQQDNFFNYKIYPKEYYKNRTFPNQITWSLTKESGSDIDVWTNITMANTLEMDGSLGSVNKLTRFNNQLISLQDKGIAHIMYNESMQISSTEGVPIELANSGKVQGKRYISNTIGCSNKWSIVTTPNGIYFIDSLDKNIYILNEGLGNISNKFGFNSWCKQQIPHTVNSLSEWNPADYEDFVSYYDKKNQDVLFINKNTALAFSEKLEAFTSFYDYGNTPYLCNFEDTGVWIDKESNLWKHQGGEYCKFFGNNKPYSVTFVGNPEPLIDKIFTNLEFRACVEGEGTVSDNVYSPYIPFDFLETWDEYQHGIATLSAKQKPGSMQHHLLDKSASLNRRYRIWACDIPRDNVPTIADQPESGNYNYTLDTELGITRFNSKPMDRMRNPWIYLKLKKQAEVNEENSLPKTEIHDLVMTYYI